MLRRLLLPLFAAMIACVAVVQVAAADALDEQTRHIAKQLQCPVCNGAPVSDSPSDLAGQMRMVIRSKLEAGETEPQIIAYFVERYGDGVLIEPPRRGFALTVWLAPVLMLVVGGIILWRLLAGWLRPRWSAAPTLSATPAASPPVPYRNGTVHADEPAAPSTVDRVRAELDRFRREA